METVTISPKFQVVMPKDIRTQLKPTPGQKVQAIACDNRIELIDPAAFAAADARFSQRPGDRCAARG